jgi:hypothetical protein
MKTITLTETEYDTMMSKLLAIANKSWWQSREEITERENYIQETITYFAQFKGGN